MQIIWMINLNHYLQCVYVKVKSAEENWRKLDEIQFHAIWGKFEQFDAILGNFEQFDAISQKYQNSQRTREERPTEEAAAEAPAIQSLDQGEATTTTGEGPAVAINTIDVINPDNQTTGNYPTQMGGVQTQVKQYEQENEDRELFGVFNPI